MYEFTSRLIIKNLPKNLTDAKFREHFAAKGRVTDAKIMKTPEGTSRCFGFVGYSTEQEANGALKYFHNTFIHTSRITVERAKPVNDSSLPRPWSAHSVGSSSYQRRHSEGQNQNQSDQIIKKGAKDQPKSKLQGEIQSNEKLREFIEVMKPRSKSKTWANDDLTASENQESKNGKNIKEIIKAQEGSDDELYQDMPTKSNDAGKVLSSDDEDSSDKSDEGDEKLKNAKSSVSDTDWLKSRMRRKLDWVADDEEDEENSLSEGESSNVGNIRKKRKVEFADDVEINDSNNQQSLKDKDSMMQDENPHNERGNTVDELPPEESIGETGRLFVRNLPYICTEEDLRKEFNKFGPLAEVHMPLDKETKKQKGFAYVLYHIPEHAVKAYIELDNKFFMGRLLHILPSKEKPQPQNQDQSKWSLKKKKEMKLKSQATNDFNWNTLYMNSDTIAESIAHRFNIKKSDILDPESDNLAARLALAETHIIQETKAYLELNGVTLNSFEKKERSDTVILVKNFAFGVTQEDLTQLFGWYGEIGRIIIPPAQTIAVVEFKLPTEARNAFKSLAYKKFRGLPLYLEKAPKDVFKDENDQNKKSSEDNDPSAKVLSSTDLVESSRDIDDDVEVSSQVIATLFVKNLSFDTDEEGLKKAFKNTPGMKSAKIKMKSDTKNPGKKLSMGFGFIEYDSLKNAKNALKAMQGFMLDGHALQLKFSNKGLDTVQRRRREDDVEKKKRESTKIIVKNLAFETTKKELRELFSAYGQIKTLRLPKKFDGTSRGFGFIEFLTKRDARNAMEKLSDTHLLGRHLVLEYAEEDKDVEELREKVGREFIGDVEGGNGRMRKKKKVDIEDWTEVNNETDE